MPTIKVDNQKLVVKDGDNLLQALLSAGIDIPYFCWHPAMGSIGACRQCAVVQYAGEDDTRGRIVMSCMTAVTDQARFSVATQSADQFRKSVIENLMLNHPHDCPVCEEGGECHLQDMTVMSGHSVRHYEGKKTTYRNQYLGPFIGHEMNRCITCYRCVRYYQDHAGGHDLNAFGSRDRVFFGRVESGLLESEFAGNLVEVCPTGVFTDKTFSKHYTRKWDLQSSPTICQGCSLGCNTYTSERYGQLRRVQNRYHHQVNGYFLCDRGRFGAQFVNAESRIRQAGIRNSQGLYDATELKTAIGIARSIISNASTIKGIGSPRASLESNQALRELVGQNNYSNGMTEVEQAMLQKIIDVLRSPIPTPSMMQTEQCDAVLVLGEDVTNFAPRLALSLRQATQNRAKTLALGVHIPLWHDAAVREIGQSDRSPLVIVTPTEDRLDEVASHVLRLAPDNIALLGDEICHAIKDEDNGTASDNVSSVAREIAGLLKQATKPLIVAGTSLQHPGILQAALNIAITLNQQNISAGFFACASESNSLGVAMLDNQHSISDIMAEQPETLVVLENDLQRRLGDRFDASLAGIKHLIVLDHLDNPTVSVSTLVLPAATFAEAEGTYVNNEGRAQRSFATFNPAGDITPSYELLDQLRSVKRHIDEIHHVIANSIPTLAGIVAAAPAASFRIEGAKIARMTHRASGRTAIDANISVHEPTPPMDDDSPLVYSMEGQHEQAPANLRAYSWAPGWNSNQSNHKFQQEVGGSERTGDPGILVLTGGGEIKTGEVTLTHRRLVPELHIFGSDELTNSAADLATLVTAPYLRMHGTTAQSLGVVQDDGVSFEVNKQRFSFAVIVDDSMPADSLAYPLIPATVVLTNLDDIQLSKAESWTKAPASGERMITTDRSQ
jgi:NADH-quinone oxidoreductase subunit G